MPKYRVTGSMTFHVDTEVEAEDEETAVASVAETWDVVESVQEEMDLEAEELPEEDE